MLPTWAADHSSPLGVPIPQRRALSERDRVLVYVEVRDRLRPEVGVKDERVGAAASAEGVVSAGDQYVVPRTVLKRLIRRLRP
jgi:hypothetical protein